MNDALRSVRSVLGDDALIVETANVPGESGGGVEITALSEALDDACGRPISMADAVSPSIHPTDDLRHELETLKSMLACLAPGLNGPERLTAKLLKQGLSPEILAVISDKMKSDAGDERDRLGRAVASLIATGGQIGEGKDRIALLGPAGVGKTTAIIKLTIFETQRRNRRVGWINTDARGLVAGDLLAVYAGILGARYQKAASRAELKQACDRLSDCDLILVDSAGVNPRDPAAVAALGKMLNGVAGLRRALLMSAMTNGNDMIDWVSIYGGAAGIDSIFFTKLDECRYLGPLLNAAIHCKMPVSYIGLGQNVAEDLAVATPEIIASLLLAGVDIHD
jgi:flagellar biosynthesis protein FlhF